MKPIKIITLISIILLLLPFTVSGLLGYYHEQNIGISTGNNNYELRNPTSVTSTLEYIYIVDSLNNRIQVFNKNNTYVTTIGGIFGSGDYSLKYPRDLAIDGDIIYIADTENNRIQIFKGISYYGTIGTYGTENGNFKYPTGVETDENGTLYVADKNNNRIQIFYPNGTYKTKIGYNNGTGNYEFQAPTDIAVTSKNDILVIDSKNNRIQIYNNDLTYKKTIGGTEGVGDYQFNNPNGISIDDYDNIYVSDTGNNRIQIFSKDYKYSKTLFYNGQSEFALSKPSNSYVDYRTLYIADTGNNKIKIFRMDCLTNSDCYDKNPGTIDTCIKTSTENYCKNEQITNCVTGDNYCPITCTYKTDYDCTPECGNNICEKDENQTCCIDCGNKEGYSCANNFLYEKIPVCGDGVLDDNEICCLDSGCKEGYTCVDDYTCRIDGTCGDRTCNWNENEKNCCTDCNYCLPGYTCITNQCSPSNINKIQNYCENDASCNDNNTCTKNTCNLYPRYCITETIEQCINDDSCCQSPCTHLNDNDCQKPIAPEKTYGAICGNKQCDILESTETCCIDCGCKTDYECGKETNKCEKTKELLIKESIEKQDSFKTKDMNLKDNGFTLISSAIITDTLENNNIIKFVYTYSNNKQETVNIEGIADGSGYITYIEGSYVNITIYFVYAFIFFIIFIIILFLYIRQKLIKKEIKKTKDKTRKIFNDHITEFDQLIDNLKNNEKGFLKRRLNRWENEVKETYKKDKSED
ncbi:MAG: 6-bladed beta-propeller [DPANN group archaeon]|nr:6-bladed beta-propeller [DPANN group archaeon]